MRRLFFLVAMPLLFDLCVAMCLDAHRSAAPPQVEATRNYAVFFDWDGVELSPNGRRVVAAAARDAVRRAGTRIEVLSEVDNAAGLAYRAALAMERARRVRAELLHDGLTATDIRVIGPGVAPGAPRRIELVLRWTS